MALFKGIGKAECNFYIRTNRTSGLSALKEPIFPLASRSRSGKRSLPAMPARAPYKYSPLKGQQIRLLTLLPGKLNSPIRVRLHTTILSKNDVPVYEALSYAWGSADGPINLFVDISTQSDQSLPLTQNLECALQHLWYIDKPRVLWIDAICVNQQDLSERSKQVARMAYLTPLPRKCWSGLVQKQITVLLRWRHCGKWATWLRSISLRIRCHRRAMPNIATSWPWLIRCRSCYAPQNDSCRFIFCSEDHGSNGFGYSKRLG